MPSEHEIKAAAKVLTQGRWEWLHGETGPMIATSGENDYETEPQECVPASAYRDLYKAAEQMAQDIEALIHPGTVVAHEHRILDAIARFRGEGEE